MSFTGYIKDLGVNLGKMFYTDGIGIAPRDSLLGDVKLIGYDVVSGQVTGKADVSGSRFGQYAWTAGELALDGTASDDEFELSAALPEISITLQNAVFKSSSGVLKFYNRKQSISGAELFLSGTSVELDGALQIAGTSYKGTLSFVPFQSDDITRVSFAAADSRVSCLEFLTGFCGGIIDIAGRMPWWAAYQDIVKLMGIRFCVDAHSLLRMAESGTITGGGTGWAFGMVELALDVADLGFAGSWFRFENLVMEISYHPSSESPVRLEKIAGSLCILDIPVSIQIPNPFYHMEITLFELEGRPVSQLLDKFSLATPALLKDTVIQQLYLEVDFNVKGYYASVLLRKQGKSGLLAMKSAGENGDSTVSLQDAELTIDCMGEKISVQAGISLIVIKDGALVCQFRLEGSLKDAGLQLKGSLMQLTVSLAELYDSFFDTRIASKLPDISIRSLSVGVKLAEQWSVESLEGSAAISVKDKDVIGQEIEIARADIRCDRDCFVIAGSFTLGKYFTIAAEYYRSGAEMRWKFQLLLGGLCLDISYDKGTKAVSGRIQTAYSLGDMLDCLLGLLNPSESYERTGAWSFLNDISIKDTEVVYRTDTGEFSFTIKPSVKQTFLEIAALTVKMNEGGVKIQIAGEFMGTDYPQERPLQFAPNDPPVVQGCGLSVSYLLFGTGLMADGITGKDINADMKTLQKQFSRNTRIADLMLRPEAGSMFAVETDIAGTAKVRLLYLEDSSYCGGYFELYGDNASVLKGLSAELSYSKIQGSLGVFSGKFTPSKAMRRIRFGAMTFSVGSIQADIYSNGDFFLDIGYPYERNFERSFAFQYGAFSGSAGVYLQKASDARTQRLPLPKTGYFTCVLGMGIGMKLRLGYGYKGGIFSAQASLVMQGCFEGVYARRQLEDGKGQDYYELSADVLFTGSLQGKVDFGIVGAGVNVLIQASLYLTVSSEKAMETDIEFCVEAQAYVKVWFVKVKFQFSLKAKMHFSFASRDARTLGAHTYPYGLRCAGAADKVQVHAVMLPVVTRYERRPAAAVMLMLTSEEFDRMLDRMVQILGACHALETDEMELFAGRRIAENPDEIYQMLEDNFILLLDEPGNNAADTDAVLMPLPDRLMLVMERHYKGGAVDVTENELDDYELMDDAYRKTVEDYYSDTSTAQAAGSAETRSVQSWLFTDFFEMICKALRAQKEDCMLRGVSFDGGRMMQAQYENIRGIVSRFVLGGRRAPNRTGPVGVSGMAHIAGSQIEFLTDVDISDYRFRLLPNGQLPAWLAFMDGKKELAVSMTPELIAQQLPPVRFSTDIFDGEPELMPACQKVRGNTVYPAIQLVTTKYRYFALDKSMVEGKTYSAEQEWGFAGMFSLVLHREDEALPLYRIAEHKNTKQFPEWLRTIKAGQITEISYIFQSGGAYQEQSLAKGRVVCLKNISSGVDGSACYAELSETGEGLQLLWESIVTAGEYLLYFAEGNGIPVQDETEVWFVLRSGNGKVCRGWHNAIYAETDSLALTDMEGQLQQVIEQGTVCVQAHVSENGLTEDELRLRKLYSGLGAELIDTEGKVCTHETPSYFGEYDDGGGVSYFVPFPYAKALADGEPDIYQGIHTGDKYQLRLFWTDVLGNRLDAGRSVEIVPRYHDRLMGLDEYPSLMLAAYLSDGKIKLVWTAGQEAAPDEEEKEHIRYGYHQLNAEDVRILLSAEWLDTDVVLDKSRFTEFLSAVLDGEAPADMEYDTQIRVGGTGLCLLSAQISLNITRKEELCELYDGIAVEKSITQLFLQETDDSGGGMLSGADGSYILSGARVPVAQLAGNRYFRSVFLPTVSGIYTGKGGAQVKLANRDLDGILDQFLSDLAQLTRPEMLLRLYQTSDLRKGLSRIDAVYGRTADLLAGLAEPLGQYPDGSVDEKALDALKKDFFRKHLFGKRKNILFVQTDSVPTLPSDSCRLRGVVGGADGFPAWLGLSQEDCTFSFAIETQESCTWKDLTFHARYVYDIPGEITLTPDHPDSPLYSIAFSSDDTVAPAVEGIPASPVVRSVYRSSDTAEFEIGISLTAEDCLLLGFEGTGSMQQIEGEQQVYEMEQYRLGSRNCLADPTDENILALLALMERYLDAAEQFAFTTGKVSALELRLKDKGESGYRKLGCSAKDAMRKVFVSLDAREWREMAWSKDGYAADGVELPEGMPFFLRMSRQGAEKGDISLQTSRCREFVAGSPYGVSPKHILCTPQIVF